MPRLSRKRKAAVDREKQKKLKSAVTSAHQSSEYSHWNDLCSLEPEISEESLPNGEFQEVKMSVFFEHF